MSETVQEVEPIGYNETMRFPPLPLFLARLALAVTFLGFGLWEIIAPNLWTMYLPEFLKEFYPQQLVLVHGILLTVTALGVLSGYYARFFTGLAVLLLLEVTGGIWIQEGFTEIFIRDMGLLLFASSLFARAMLVREEK